MSLVWIHELHFFQGKGFLRIPRTEITVQIKHYSSKEPNNLNITSVTDDIINCTLNDFEHSLVVVSSSFADMLSFVLIIYECL